MEKIIIVPRMQIYCNSNCQLSCKFCAKSFQEIPYINLPLKEFYVIVDKLIDFGINKFELSPVVGESFLDPYIKERVSYLSNHNSVKQIVIFTNLLNYEPMKDILSHPKVELNISIYGTDRTGYAAHTGKNLYDKFIDNLLNLLNLVKKNNIKEQVILYIRCPYKKKKGYNFKNQFEKCYIMAKFMGIKIWEAKEDTDWEKMINTNQNEIKHIPERGGICKFIIEDNCVFPNGNIIACGWFGINEQPVIGNIFKQSLEEIYSIKSRYFNILLEQNKKNYQGICKNCTIYKAQECDTCITLEDVNGNYVPNNRALQS